MSDIQKQIDEKKAQLAELHASKSKANCSDHYSKSSDVNREIQIEELEDEIKALEKQLA